MIVKILKKSKEEKMRQYKIGGEKRKGEAIYDNRTLRGQEKNGARREEKPIAENRAEDTRGEQNRREEKPEGKKRI